MAHIAVEVHAHGEPRCSLGGASKREAPVVFYRIRIGTAISGGSPAGCAVEVGVFYVCPWRRVLFYHRR